MYKQSSGRNNKSKGIKFKHVLQLCLLLALCFWLMYQVKRSYDKKKEFAESDEVKATRERNFSDEVPKLGRKDIHSPEGETTFYNIGNKSDENIQEKNKINHEVDGGTPSHEKADVGEKGEATKGENKETNENKREGSDTEMELEDEFIDDSFDGVAPEADSEGEKNPIEKENEPDSDGVVKSTHNAQEEHYKADDASSAVSQDTHGKPSAENEHINSQEENKGSDNVEGANQVENSKDLEVGASKDDKESNITPASNSNELISGNSENGLAPNGTVTQGFEGNFTTYNAAEVLEKDMPFLNATENIDKLDHTLRNLDKPASNDVSILDAYASGLMNHSRLNEGNNGVDDSNSTRGSESNSESAPEKMVTSEEASAETHNNTRLTTEVKDETQSEGSGTNNNGTNKSLGSTYNQILEVAKHESIDLSDSSNVLEEMAVKSDLDTLPVIVIQSEGIDMDDIAAE